MNAWNLFVYALDAHTHTQLAIYMIIRAQSCVSIMLIRTIGVCARLKRISIAALCVQRYIECLLHGYSFLLYVVDTNFFLLFSSPLRTHL